MKLSLKKILLKKSLSLEVKKVKFSIQRDVLGILAAKKTSELIPLCHNIDLNTISIDFEVNKKSQ